VKHTIKEISIQVIKWNEIKHIMKCTCNLTNGNIIGFPLIKISQAISYLYSYVHFYVISALFKMKLKL
jgi:hypothetical protein